MKQTRPVLHARDHMAGGADPILPSIAAAGNYPAAILALPDLRGYWRLGEGVSPYADTSGFNPSNPATMGRNTGSVGSTPMTQDVTPGLLPTAYDDGAVAFNQDENEPSPAREHLIDADGSSRVNFDFSSTHPTMSVVARVQPAAATHSFWGGIVGYTVLTTPRGNGGWGLRVRYPTMQIEFFRGLDVASVHTASSPPVAAGQAYTVAGTYDGALIRLYINGVLAASVADTSNIGAGGANTVSIGGFFWDDVWEPFLGVIDEVAVFGSVLTDSDIAALHGSASGGDATDPGDVLTLGPDGHPVWAPPTVTVTGGGINVTPPDDTPVDSSSGPYAGTPTTGTGWHLQAHTETVILHDATRGRFDVPTMKWTRVPFNAIRISRTWEPTVGGATVKTALLPDDRGLSGPARDGILHINSDMVWSSPQTVGGWFSIEYPVLEPGGLPDDDPEVGGDGPRPEAPRPGDPIAAPDTYMRAARMMNLSQGYVLRTEPGEDTRAIFGWGFWDTANGIGDSPFNTLVDNPFPTWPIWAARPLHMLPPYPQMSPADSRTYYVNYLGDPGFRFDGLQVHTDLAAGANLCLQAWQDAPWLIRFSTDRFPAYHGYTGSYRGYPYLQITFAYDPDTIDHTTGKLLLPAPA